MRFRYKHCREIRKHLASKLAKTTDFNIKNAEKLKILKAQKWIKNRYKSSSGPKECQKNHF